MADLAQSKFFSLHEFEDREIEVAFASQNLFSSLDDYREKLGVRIFPSPVQGALARFDGSKTSQHFVAGAVDDKPFESCTNSEIRNALTIEGRVETIKFSTAIDIFVEDPAKNFWKAYVMALSCGHFGGVGVYAHTRLDGVPHPMLHLDIRPHVFPTIWARTESNDYIYPLRGYENQRMFLKELQLAIGF